MSAAAIKSQSGYKIDLEIKSGPHAGSRFSLTKEQITIGRGSDNDVVLDSDQTISRSHVKIQLINGKVLVENISEKNNLLLNGNLIHAGELRSGNTLGVGACEIQCHIEGLEAPAPVFSGKSVAPTPKKPGLPSTTNKNPNLGLSPAAEAGPVIQNFPQPPPLPHQSGQPNNISRAKPYSQPKGDGLIKIILGVVVLGIAYWLFFDTPAAKNKAPTKIRTSSDIQKEVERSQRVIEETTQQRLQNHETRLSAHSYYVRGFRDYRNGQYSRAIQAFQAALAFDPEHQLSKKYLLLSQRKFEELVQFNIAQGKKYRSINNYKLCMSSFKNVMIMKKDINDPVYLEAKTLYQDCEIQLMGRF